MKTTIDIPDKSLREAMKHTGAKTRSAAVLMAMTEFNRRCRLEEMAGRLHGFCPDFMSQQDLKRMRQNHKGEPKRS